MSILAIARETFETTRKNTIVTDMLTNMFFKRKTVTDFFERQRWRVFRSPKKTDIYLEMITNIIIFYHLLPFYYAR